MGLYQSTATVFNATGTVAGTVNGASFSAANFAGGVGTVTTGTVTGTSPTVAVALQISTDGGTTWVAAPATSNSLTALNASTAAASAGTVVTACGTAYVGNLLRYSVTFAGTGSLSIPFKIVLDQQKRFADNA